MELNQEYYNTTSEGEYQGEIFNQGRYLYDIVEEMQKNGLDHMDESNIWCLHSGSHLIGSGGSSGRSATATFGKDSRIELRDDDMRLVYGAPGETTGPYKNFTAIRWFNNETLQIFGTMAGNITTEKPDIRVITNMCMKHLIAVPAFYRATITKGIGDLNQSLTRISYQEALQIENKSYTKTDQTFELAILSGFSFYYGSPGHRTLTSIFPLFESNIDGISYFGGIYSMNINYPPYYIQNVTAYTDQFATYGGYAGRLVGNGRNLPLTTVVDADGTPIPSYSVPVWVDPWFNSQPVTPYINRDGLQSAILSPEADSVHLVLSNGYESYGYHFKTVQGANDIANALGIVWAEDVDSAINYDPDAASVGAYKVHLGTLDSNGINYKGYTSSGDDIKKQTNFGICEITDSLFTGRIPDNPGQEIDPDTGQIELNTPGVTPFNTFNHMYCMTQSEVNDFASKIWNADETLWEQIVSGLSLYGEMPINAIISLRMYPIDLLKLFDVASTSIMRIGKTAITLDSQTEFVTKQKTAVVNMGSCVFPARYNNFLDYEPYTKAMLYLPYCGTVDVATADVVGKTVQVYYIIDVMTGGCTAVVYFGGIPYFYKNGRVGVEIPITANADSAVTSDALSLVTGGASSLLAAATGNPVAAALSLPSMVNSGLQIAKDSRSSFQTTGTQTPTAAQWTPQNAYFIVQRSVPDEPAGYGHSVGYVTLEGGTLGSFTGYTVMSNPDLTGVDCTEGEKEMIRNLLESGIYC